MNEGSFMSTITIPQAATKTQIDNAKAAAVKAGAGSVLQFPAGKLDYPARFVIPDGVTVLGKGIWNQGRSDGGGGSWLACHGATWGAGLAVQKLLMGVNLPGVSSQFRPVARTRPDAGPETQRNGSHDVLFSLVRFKGGSDSGGAVIDTGSNWSGDAGGGWKASLKTIDMVRHTFRDVEIERSQAANAVGRSASFPNGNPGDCMNLWWDCRKGGARLEELVLDRVHLGCRNGYHSGVDGYGMGTGFLIQPGPTGKLTGVTRDGSSDVTSKNWNPDFDWTQIDHGAGLIAMTDVLCEYATWYPMDLCDHGRDYSMWQGTYDFVHKRNGVTRDDGGAQEGWGNPPGSKWTAAPAAIWLKVAMTRVYNKGSLADPRTGHGHGVVGEVCSGSYAKDCFCGSGSVFNQAGRCGNTASGSFPGGHPKSPIFTADWTGSTTSYTKSPYDPVK